MSSDELRNCLNAFNGIIDSIINKCSSVSSSIKEITTNINSLKGVDSAMYSGINENNSKARYQVKKIVTTLASLKSEVNDKTKTEIARLAAIEESSRRDSRDGDEGGIG